MQVQHLSRSDSWYTPPYVVSLVKKVLGTIELDPASEFGANQVIQAKEYFTKEDDALSKEFWCYEPKTIFLNPPGSKIGNKSKSGLFWNKLMDHYEAGLIDHAIFMGFSLEQLAVTQSSKIPMTRFTVCIPRKRIAFVDPTDATKKQPSHANVIVYIPSMTNKVSLFKDTFSVLGDFMTYA